MNALRPTIKAYLELMRLSNAPTVVSNVLVGVAIGRASGGQVNGLLAISMTIGVLLLYAGGMIMNDLADARVDRREKPERPIPSGRVSASYARMLMASCLVAGTVLILPGGAAAFGWTALLIAAITGYNLLHKRTVTSVVLMGACRGLVYLLAAASIAHDLHWPIALAPASAISTYIIALTLAARAEATNQIGLGRQWSIIMILVSLAPALLIFPDQPTAMIVAGLALIGWLVLTQRHLLRTPPRVKDAVHGWLAAICLIDALYLCLLGWPELAVIAWACFAATLLGQRVVSGT